MNPRRVCPDLCSSGYLRNNGYDANGAIFDLMAKICVCAAQRIKNGDRKTFAILSGSAYVTRVKAALSTGRFKKVHCVCAVPSGVIWWLGVSIKKTTQMFLGEK